MPSEMQMLATLEAQAQPLETASGLLKILIYGDSGVGKTVGVVELAQTIVPPDKEILYIDSHEGWVSLLNHDGLRNRMRRFKWEGIAQQSFLAKAVKRGLGSFNNVGGIIYDETTAMANSDLDLVLKTRAAEDSKKDPDVATQPDMGASTERMRRLLWEILELPVHLFFVGHMRVDEDDAKVRVVSPDFMPKLNKRFREPMHLVGHAFTVERQGENGAVNTERFIQVHPTRKVIAKTRVGGFKKKDTTWDELTTNIQAWLGSGNVLIPEKEMQAEKPELVDSVSNSDEGIVVD